MNRLFVTMLLLVLIAMLLAEEEAPLYEPHAAVIKILPELKSSLRLGFQSTGIADIDDLIGRMGIIEVKPRFRTDPKLSSPVDLSLILELRLPAGLNPLGVSNAFSRLSSIAYAEPIWIDSVLDAPNDPNYAASLYFNSLQAEAAWAIHKGENGAQEIILGVVDTGLNWKHPDIVQNVWQNLGEDANANGYTIWHNGSAWVYDAGDLNGIDDDGNGKADDLVGWDFKLDEGNFENYDPYESSGHGTSVSGIANSRTNNSLGVASLAWNVTLMPVSCSYPGSSYIYRGYDGMLYAAQMGADVINCSWGGTGFGQANQDAVNYVWSLGTVIVAAAGNSNNTTPIYPAGYQNVVAVASINNDGTANTTSCYGAFVSVAAPTQQVGTISGSSSYGLVNNATSYATPIGSSLAALIRSQHPTWTNTQVVNQLVATCDNIDALNPGREHCYGQGKLNAYRALSEVNPVPDQELRLILHQVLAPTDQNGNGAIEPGEQFTLNLRLRNYSIGVQTNTVTYTLSCADPSLTILQNTATGAISGDSFIDLSSAFLLQVAPGTNSKFITLNLDVSSNLPIVFGANHSFQVLVNAGGTLVWEGVAGSRNMSGAYIRTNLQAQGDPVAYGTLFPASFLGFDAVYLSFGAAGGNLVRFATNEMFDAVRDYLESGGNLYLEGGEAIIWDLVDLFPEVEPGLNGGDILWPLLGIAGGNDGTASNPVSCLSGAMGWHSLDLLFTGSNQTANQFMDIYEPNQNGLHAFIEDDYGTVAVQSLGAYGQRVFAMSYALRELIDGSAPNTRLELLTRIRDFFFDPTLELPEVHDLTLERSGASSVRLSWSYPFTVDEFEVYAEDAPDAVFDTLLLSTPALEAVFPSQSKKFYRVKALREFGQ